MLIRKKFGERVRVDIEIKSGLLGKSKQSRVEGYVELRGDGGFGVRTDACELVTFDGRKDPSLVRVYHHANDISVPHLRISDNASSTRFYVVDGQGVTFECA